MTGRRVLVLADTDSYVKWGASLVSPAPDGWTPMLAVLDGHAAPSERQVVDALDGTGTDPAEVRRLDARLLHRTLHGWRPDVVVLAVRGHVVPVVARMVEELAERRPVLVTGVAGICVPVQWYDVNLRRGADVFVVHSHRERRDLAEVAARHGVAHRVALATLPFLRVAARRPVLAGHTATPTLPAGGPVVFAPQSLVPATEEDREVVVRGLGRAVGPDREVHVKIRAHDDELEAHRGVGDYPTLVASLRSRGVLPDGLRVVDGPMARHLYGASGFVTIGSSAALEAVAADVPTVVLTDLGVDDAHLNSVFVGSGLLGSLADVEQGRFRRVDPGWAAENYLHDPADDDWVGQVEALLRRRDDGDLAPPARVPATLGNRVRAAYYRLDALAPWRGTPLEPLERIALTAARWLNRVALHLR